MEVLCCKRLQQSMSFRSQAHTKQPNKKNEHWQQCCAAQCATKEQRQMFKNSKRVYYCKQARGNGGGGLPCGLGARVYRWTQRDNTKKEHHHYQHHHQQLKKLGGWEPWPFLNPIPFFGDEKKSWKLVWDHLFLHYTGIVGKGFL